MAEVIRMPRMSDTMEEGNIVAWHKQTGDTVEIGDLLAEIETDKATMDFESPSEGVLLHVAVQEGGVAIGGVLAVIGQEGEDYQAAIAADAGGEVEEKPAETGADSTPPQPEESPDSTPAVVIPVTPGGDSSRVKASPLARKIAEESGVSLSGISGTGDNGRIVRRDVEQYLDGGQKQAVPATQPAAPQAPAAAQVSVRTPAATSLGSYEDKPLSQMRKVIARRLGESKFSAPHFYLTIEVNMDQAIAARKQINAIAPSKISFNDIVVKSCATALQQHPTINSSWLGDKIRVNHDINIGVAVAVEEGLLVPVIRHTNAKTLSQINTEVRELAGKAKERKLQAEEMQGNTFTISNLGMFGIEEFTAIINPPDACILAVGGIIQKPVVKDGEIVVGNMMKVTLSCDHRVVDGASGAQFLQTLKGILEDPIRMVV